jgi:hypothetical protein
VRHQSEKRASHRVPPDVRQTLVNYGNVQKTRKTIEIQLLFSHHPNCAGQQLIRKIDTY